MTKAERVTAYIEKKRVTIRAMQNSGDGELVFRITQTCFLEEMLSFNAQGGRGGGSLETLEPNQHPCPATWRSQVGGQQGAWLSSV